MKKIVVFWIILFIITSCSWLYWEVDDLNILKVANNKIANNEIDIVKKIKKNKEEVKITWKQEESKKIESKKLKLIDRIKLEKKLKENKLKIEEPKKELYFNLKPYKNDLFKYQWGVLKSEFNGDIKLIDYSVFRDIEERDVVDVVKVYEKYTEKIPQNFKILKKYKSDNWEKKYWEIKNANLLDDEIKIITIYFYWYNWNIDQWVNNETFWGNFNRIQNLMIKNNWIYISTEFTNFSNQWVKDISVLLNDLKLKYKNADILLSAGSSGWTLIWNILKQESLKSIIKWVILIGSVVDNNYLVNENIPIYIWHWTKDKNLPYTGKYTFYNEIKNQKQNYPIKIEFFDWWLHWTPLRMIDWYLTINWILKINYYTK